MNIRTISAKNLIDTFKQISKNDFGWVMYRFPGSTDVILTSGETIGSTLDDQPDSCFIIAPFYSKENQLWRIRNTIQYSMPDPALLITDLQLPFYFNAAQNENPSSQAYYINLVQEVIDEIKSGAIQKAVPARSKNIRLSRDFLSLELYRKLLSAYPNAFVYMMSTPLNGTWAGCSPELLLHLKDNEINTLSLAGTKKVDEVKNNTKSVLFSAKEIEEQAIVTRYIQRKIEKYCDKIRISGPEKLSAGNIDHLATHFKGSLKSGYHGKYFQLLKDLHPTPAVCGMPMEQSRDFLLKHENFDRSLYSGFLGPAEEKEAHIYVNLRCMQLFEKEAILYAGAGVVQGSVPEKEWLETEEKMNTLGRFVG